MERVTIEEISQKFSLEVLSGQDQLQRVIKRARVRRPGLEFMDKFDFMGNGVYSDSG